MEKLSDADLGFVVRRLPKDVRLLLEQYPGRLFLGGGFVRAVIAGEQPSDIDLFGETEPFLDACAQLLTAARGKGCRLHKTKNALTVLSIGRLTVQFITRWTFMEPEEVAKSFDFTICQAVIWRSGKSKSDPWMSNCHPSFYQDLAARRLVYTCPSRDEEAGGSMLRIIKFTKRGYVCQVDTLAKVIARLVRAVDTGKIDTMDEFATSFILCGLLREVDPLLALDGLEVIGGDPEVEE